MLVDDGLALARAGLSAYDDILGLVEFLAGETASAPWAAFQNSIDFVAAQCRAAGDEDARDFDVSPSAGRRPGPMVACSILKTKHIFRHEVAFRV